jgi:hypothetical protein
MKPEDRTEILKKLHDFQYVKANYEKITPEELMKNPYELPGKLVAVPAFPKIFLGEEQMPIDDMSPAIGLLISPYDKGLLCLLAGKSKPVVIQEVYLYPKDLEADVNKYYLSTIAMRLDPIMGSLLREME